MGVMTEIAAVRGLVLVMTFHEINHSSGPFLRYDAPISQRTMTNGALDVGLLMMHLVREIRSTAKACKVWIAGLSFWTVLWQPMQNVAPGNPARSPGAAIV
jgi:hypothetical protein